jgi:hypothetical protein
VGVGTFRQSGGRTSLFTYPSLARVHTALKICYQGPRQTSSVMGSWKMAHRVFILWILGPGTLLETHQQRTSHEKHDIFGRSRRSRVKHSIKGTAPQEA